MNTKKRNLILSAVFFGLIFPIFLFIIASCHVPALEIKPKDIDVDKIVSELRAGETEQVTAAASFGDLSLPNTELAWTSSNPEIATVDQLGNITGVSAGTTTITVCSVADPTVCQSVVVTINPLFDSFDLSRSATTVLLDGTLQLSTIIRPVTDNVTVSYLSDNIAIATVTETGLVTGVALGSTTITATLTHSENTATSSATTVVTVVEPPEVTPSIAFGIIPIQIAPTQQSPAIILLGQDGAPLTTVTYQVSNNDIATIDENGVLTGVTDGTVTVTATNTETDESVTSSITVVTPTGTAPTASPIESQVSEDIATLITLSGFDQGSQPLTYTIESGPVNGALTGTEPELTYTPNENFVGTDTFTYSVNNGTEDSEVETVSITTLAVNDVATDIELSSVTVNENEGGTSESGTVVATLSNDDPDTTDTYTYSLVSGTGDTDNDLFTIEGDTLLMTADADHETQSSLSALIQVTDDNDPPGTFQEEISISVADTNDVPTGVTVSSNILIGTQVGSVASKLTVIDSDTATENLQHNVELAAGTGDTHNHLFDINEDNELVLAEPISDDLVGEEISIKVAVSDGSEQMEQVITMSVTSLLSASATVLVDMSTVAGGYDPSDIVAHDFDGDGDIDIVYAGNSQINLLVNNGDEGFSAPSLLLINPFAMSSPQNIYIDLEDFNSDGNTDIMLSSFTPMLPYILINEGNNKFIVREALSATNQKNLRAAIGDVDGDGNKDIVHILTDNTILVNYSDGAGNFTGKTIASGIEDPLSPIVIEGTGDTPSKVVITAYEAGLVAYSYDSTTATLTTGSSFLTNDTIQNYYSSDLIDIDDDGDLDIVTDITASSSTDHLITFLNTGGTFSADFVTLHTGILEYSRMIKDINDDNKADMIYVEDAASLAFYKFRTDDLNYTEPVQVGDNIRYVTTGDIDGDGDEDFLLNKSTGVEVFINNLVTQNQDSDS